jgi:hypothetical protein
MKPQYLHNVATSFALWLDHYLLDKGEAYSNETGKLYYYSDPRLPTGYRVFGSPYKQWVYDSSITGANIPSGVYVNSTFTPRAANKHIDFINGRVIYSGVATGAAVTGSFAVKDFNIYFSNENEEDLILENNLKSNEKMPWSGSTYLPPYDNALPAIYINTESLNNVPFSFGGEDESRAYMKCVVFADDQFSLDGVLSLFADSKNRLFKQKGFTEYPLNEFGDIKTPPYTFENVTQASTELYIDDIVVSKFKDTKGISKSYIGFMDFDIIKYRYPRA